jgi:transmembrane sensor
MSKIDDEALDWVVKQSAGELSDADRQAFEAWYDSDIRCQGAHLRAQAIWHSLDKATVQPNLQPRVRLAGRDQPGISRRMMIGGMGLVAASAAGLGVYAFVERPPSEFHTTIGEMRKVPLQDRSIASLNSDSRLRVEMTATLRRVVLVQGEALFEVAKNPDKPFVVEAGNVRVRAVGTAFSVRRREAGADVLVTEGIVEVWNTEARPRRVHAGESAFVPEMQADIAVVPEAEEISRRLSWRDGKIVLKNQTLAEAVDEFNRYNQIKISIEDPAIRGNRLVGQYRVDQPEDFADSVRELMDVPVKYETKRIRLGDARPADKR